MRSLSFCKHLPYSSGGIACWDVDVTLLGLPLLYSQVGPIPCSALSCFLLFFFCSCCPVSLSPTYTIMHCVCRGKSFGRFWATIRVPLNYTKNILPLICFEVQHWGIMSLQFGNSILVPLKEAAVHKSAQCPHPWKDRSEVCRWHRTGIMSYISRNEANCTGLLHVINSVLQLLIPSERLLMLQYSTVLWCIQCMLFACFIELWVQWWLWIKLDSLFLE